MVNYTNLEKCLSSTGNHTTPSHFSYGVRRFWTSWISPLRQKIRHNKRKFVATSDLHQKSDNWIIGFIQLLHQLWTCFQSPEGGTD